MQYVFSSLQLLKTQLTWLQASGTNQVAYVSCLQTLYISEVESLRLLSRSFNLLWNAVLLRHPSQKPLFFLVSHVFLNNCSISSGACKRKSDWFKCMCHTEICGQCWRTSEIRGLQSGLDLRCYHFFFFFFFYQLSFLFLFSLYFMSKARNTVFKCSIARRLYQKKIKAILKLPRKFLNWKFHSHNQ